ncbi:MAG: hypothetical protein MJB14_01790 [Spirochaetes bacterium]|nr:hypothetical protein [Spirochaetota bacterium]
MDTEGEHRISTDKKVQIEDHTDVLGRKQYRTISEEITWISNEGENSVLVSEEYVKNIFLKLILDLVC